MCVDDIIALCQRFLDVLSDCCLNLLLCWRNTRIDGVASLALVPITVQQFHQLSRRRHWHDLVAGDGGHVSHRPWPQTHTAGKRLTWSAEHCWLKSSAGQAGHIWPRLWRGWPSPLITFGQVWPWLAKSLDNHNRPASLEKRNWKPRPAPTGCCAGTMNGASHRAALDSFMHTPCCLYRWPRHCC